MCVDWGIGRHIGWYIDQVLVAYQMSVGEVLAGQHFDLSSVNRQFSTVSVGAGGGGGGGLVPPYIG